MLLPWGLLEILAQTNDPAEMLPEAQAYVQKQVHKLKRGRIPLENLLVSQKLSKVLAAYKAPSPSAKAARHREKYCARAEHAFCMHTGEARSLGDE